MDQFRSMIDNLREVVFQTDMEGRWTLLNPAWEEITGFSIRESLGQPCLEFVHADDRQDSREQLGALLEGEKQHCRHEVRYLTKAGGLRWIEVHARLSLNHAGTAIGVSGTLTDITDRQRITEELRQARGRLEFLLASNPAVIFTGKPGPTPSSWGTAFISDNVRGVLGHEPAEFTTRPDFFLQILHPDDRHAMEWSFMELATQGETTFRCRSRHRDGSYRWVRGDVHLVRDQDGRPVESIGCLVDETSTREIEESLRQRSAILERTEAALRRAHDDLERRVGERTAELESLNRALRQEIAVRQEAEAALAHREIHFRALLDNTLDVMFVVDHAGVIQYVSPSITRVLQYAPEEVLGRVGFDFLHEEDLSKVLEMQRVILSLPGTHPVQELRARHRNGSWRTVETVGNNQLANPAVQGVILTVRDVTDRKRLEEQFRQAQKMEAVGRLAGGVAHDFNNLLTVIRGYSELLAKRIDAESPLRRQVKQIKRAADRAVALVQQLLAFSRKQVVEPRILDLNTAIAGLESMLGRLIGEDVELSIAPAPEPVFVRVDPTQLEQVVMNLAVNARDAMPHGGSLSIATGPHRIRDAMTCRSCRIATGHYAALTVRDTGTGMSEDVRTHIFEPFFTTKEVGKGTGLGLSMVYGAVEQAGGSICFDSEPGEGTTFRVCLPLVDSPAAATAGRDPAETPPAGSETILLVEDEELVRVMIRDSLTEAGYGVIEASQGDHAMRLLEQHKGPLHLLLTDVIMPRMSGAELAQRLAPAWPDTKVLYISGYPRQELAPSANFLKKPFTPDELIREVRRILDGE
jgi:PAS domain S-box-containing protein